MFEQAVQVSQALEQARGQDLGALIPALSGCERCQTVQMVTAPMLGACHDCGAELALLSDAELRGAGQSTLRAAA